MRALVLVVALAACGKDEPSKPAVGGTAHVKPRADAGAKPAGTTGPRDTAAALADLRVAAACDEPASPRRIWCLVTEGWAAAEPAPLPDAAVLAGLTVELADGTTADESLDKHISLAALALRDDAGRRLAKITAVRPTSNDQATMVLEAMANLMILFKGNGEAAVIADGLRTYFDSLPAKAGYTLDQKGAGWSWSDGSTAELRRVAGGWWVAVATPPGGGGKWISIFTDRLTGPPATSN